MLRSVGDFTVLPLGPGSKNLSGDSKCSRDDAQRRRRVAKLAQREPGVPGPRAFARVGAGKRWVSFG